MLVKFSRLKWICAAFALLMPMFTESTAAADEEAPAAAVEKKNPAPVRHGSAFVDPLGLLLFGPRIGVEVGGERVSGALYARWFNMGLLSHSLFLNEPDNFGFSYGVGARGRYYLSEGLRGTHVGVAAEYLRGHIDNRSVLITTETGYVIPQAEAGYRLMIGNFYADASAVLGYAIKISGSVENLPGGNAARSYQSQDKSSFYGSAALDLGVYF